MNIMFLITDMSGQGGTERVTAMIASGLATDNDVSIVSLRNGTKSRYKMDDRIRLISLEGEKYDSFVTQKKKLISNLKKSIEQQDTDIIIVVDIELDIYTYIIRRKLQSKKIKTVGWEHFNYYMHSGIKGKLSRKIAARYMDCLVVLGKNDYNSYKNNEKYIKRLEYIYNPIALSTDRKSALKSKNVIAVGRLEEQKGFDMLIKAWQQVVKQCDEWKLFIVGSGSKEHELKQYIETHNINNIEMIGYTDKIEELYLDSSLFVLSSRYEGFVLVLLEAQAKGLPIISFNCKEGPAEIIKDEINGKLVEEGDVEQLAMQMIRAMKDRELLRAWASHAQDDLDRFNTDKILEQWRNLLQSL